ncbi:MAG TPA: thiamine pyrophosphate-dependent enzyme [Acidimicrobiales bacterium]
MGSKSLRRTNGHRAEERTGPAGGGNGHDERDGHPSAHRTGLVVAGGAMITAGATERGTIPPPRATAEMAGGTKVGRTKDETAEAKQAKVEGDRKAEAKKAKKAKKAEKAKKARSAKDGKSTKARAAAEGTNGKGTNEKAKKAKKAARKAKGKKKMVKVEPDLAAAEAAEAVDTTGRPDAAEAPGPVAYPADELRRDLLLACISRAIDDREIALQKQSRVFFQISGAGHEALYLALAHELRPGYDWFFPYYRDLALMLGLGVTPEQALLQAVGSRDDPASGGRQMPAHWGYRELNVVTQSSPTGSQCIPAVGCAEAGRYIVRRPELRLPAHGDEVTYVSLGEGACSEGEFWESLNTACTEHLPVLYVVADNGYAISVPSSEQAPAPVSELVRGFAGLQVRTVDGTDYFAVRQVASEVVPHVRAGVGPALIHARVTRPYSHSAADTQSKYRLAEELEWEREHDPIDRFERTLIEAGVVTADEAASIREEARRVVADAARAAIAAPRPDPMTVLDHVVALPDLPDPGEPPTDGEPVAMGEAIRRALHDQMAADERIRVFGEDVADAREAILAQVDGKGGVFGTTHGLQREFGRARCFNTPLAEANIIGRAVGQGIRGLRPAPEIQFFDYIWPAMQQLKSEAATIRWRSNGAFTCPMVVRVPIGGYLQGGAIWHSQSGESIFAHVPGLLIAFPSRASDAAGLLRAAFRCEDPVLFLEHKHLLRQPYTREPFPGPDYVVPFGRGRYVTRGDDLTVVTWGATVERSRQAAARLAEAGEASVEVIDLRTLVPYDQEMVAESVKRTSRLLVVHEDILRGGFGAEIASWAGQELFWELDAPVARIGAQNCHVAYAPELEAAILPQVDDIVAAVRAVLAA